MKEPNLPIEHNKNKRILTDEQLVQAEEMLLEGNSQVYVAKYFKVSFTAISRHVYPHYRKKLIDGTKKWNKLNPEKVMEQKRKYAKASYHLKNKLFPKEMKEARKVSKLLMGKEYFRKKGREYRKNKL